MLAAQLASSPALSQTSLVAEAARFRPRLMIPKAAGRFASIAVQYFSHLALAHHRNHRLRQWQRDYSPQVCDSKMTVHQRKHAGLLMTVTE